jgi:nicotinamidase-related amidase
MSISVVDPNKVGIILVDAQPFFWDCMHGAQEPVLVRIQRLLMLADWLRMPFIATFEHPVETKGWLPQRLEGVFPSHGQRFVKHTFNCCTDASIHQAIVRSQIRQVVVAGAETDVCVLQSCLGLLGMGLQVFLVEDCIFTSEHHARPALERMYRAGVVPCTLKSFFYELMRTVDKDALPAKWKARADSFAEHFQLESLPPVEPVN